MIAQRTARAKSLPRTRRDEPFTVMVKREK
jgi:hypothetical protein